MAADKSNTAAVASNGTSKSKTTSTKYDTKQSSGDWSQGQGLLPGREVIGPLLLMLSTPCFSIVFFHVVTYMNGNFLEFGCQYVQGELSLYSIWPTPWDPQVWQMIFGFMGFQLFLMKAMPGKRFEATLTPKGNRPVYKANGMQCYLFTLLTMWVLTSMGYIRPALVYDKFGSILSSMNVFALGFCTMLLIKGHVAPSSTDSGSNGNAIIDFFWGMELYPRILGWDVKMFTNCRSGMMFWAVGILCFAHKNMEVHDGKLQYAMAVNVIIQLVYISKFFYWEMGYMCSMDIQHDRAGYYICWGCLVWVPAVYTSHSFYLATHGPELSPLVAISIMLAGIFMVWMNYDSDRQRYIFRSTKGNCTIWGKSGPQINKIVATYTTSEGEERKSLLLVDGWWKISRHFHYVPEILASFFWSLPALDTAFVAPYFYVIYLTILLTDRAYRDDDRCRSKYGVYWEEYCQQVPYKIVPGIV